MTSVHTRLTEALLSEASGELYRVMSDRAIIRAMQQHKLEPGTMFGISLLSLSAKPLIYWKKRDAMVVFDKAYASQYVEPVEYTYEWAKAHPKHVMYITGIDVTKQSPGVTASDMNDMRGEYEWIGRKFGQSMPFSSPIVKRIVVLDPRDFEELTLAARIYRFTAPVVPASSATFSPRTKEMYASHYGTDPLPSLGLQNKILGRSGQSYFPPQRQYPQAHGAHA